MALLLAFAAGGGLVLLLELADKGIRRSSDIFGIVDSRRVIAIPYITTQSELVRRKQRTRVLVGVALVFVIGAVVATYLLMPPLDLIIAKARIGLFK